MEAIASQNLLHSSDNRSQQVTKYERLIKRNGELRRLLKEHRVRSRSMVQACLQKVQERDQEVQRLHMQREEELALIARQLIVLKSNMLKERNRLEAVIESQRETIEKLNTKLSQDKSSTENGAEKSNQIVRNKILRSVPVNARLALHCQSTADNSTTSSYSSSNESSPKSSFAASKGDNISKPPVPSRAGVNRKLILKANDTKGNGGAKVKAKPTPPPRISSTQKDNQPPDSPNDEGFSSSHEDNKLVLTITSEINPEDDLPENQNVILEASENGNAETVSDSDRFKYSSTNEDGHTERLVKCANKRTTHDGTSAPSEKTRNEPTKDRYQKINGNNDMYTNQKVNGNPNMDTIKAAFDARYGDGQQDQPPLLPPRSEESSQLPPALPTKSFLNSSGYMIRSSVRRSDKPEESNNQDFAAKSRRDTQTINFWSDPFL